MPARVCFWVDAGPRGGLGHLQRCLSLALALKRQRVACLFRTSDEPAVQALVAEWGFTALRRERPRHQEILEIIRATRRHRCRAVVVDSYRVDGEDLARLRAAGLFVVAIDDLARFPFACHLVVNGAALAEELPYRAAEGDTRFLLGPRYVPLRPEFWRSSRREIRRRVQHMLVTVGGADPHRVIPALLRVCDELPGAFGVTVVVGPFARAGRETGSFRRPVRVVRAPNRIRRLMMEADLAVAGGGQTLYELAATGTPTVALELASNQAHNLRALAALGVVRVGGRVGKLGMLDEVRAAAGSLLTDWRARAAMSAAGQRVVDGRGAERVARIIRDEL